MKQVLGKAISGRSPSVNNLQDWNMGCIPHLFEQLVRNWSSLSGTWPFCLTTAACNRRASLIPTPRCFNWSASPSEVRDLNETVMDKSRHLFESELGLALHASSPMHTMQHSYAPQAFRRIHTKRCIGCIPPNRCQDWQAYRYVFIKHLLTGGIDCASLCWRQS